MAAITLRPTTNTTAGWTSAPNNVLNDDNDGTYAYDTTNADTTVTTIYDIDAVGGWPGDFGTMDSSGTVQCRIQEDTPNADMTWDDLSVRIMSGATVLAASDSGGTTQSLGNPADSATAANFPASPATWGYINTTADSTTWQAATVEISQTRNRTKGGATVQFRVLELTFSGTYTAAANPTATGALTFPATTVSGTGDQADSSTGALALPGLVISGTASQSNDATGALALQPIVIDGTADIAFEATGAVDLASIVIDGTGNAISPATATGAVVLPAVTITGTGAQADSGTGSLALSPLTISGTGAYDTKTASGTPTLEPIVISGTAAQAYTASGAVDLASIVISGTGLRGGTNGTGDVILPALSMDGTAVLAYSGSGGVDLPSIVISGTATAANPVEATGSLDLPAIVISGTGVNGSVSVIAPIGRRRRPPPEPQRLKHEATGVLVLAPLGLSGQGGTQEDILPFVLGVSPWI